MSLFLASKSTTNVLIIFPSSTNDILTDPDSPFNSFNSFQMTPLLGLSISILFPFAFLICDF